MSLPWGDGDLLGYDLTEAPPIEETSRREILDAILLSTDDTPAGTQAEADAWWAADPKVPQFAWQRACAAIMSRALEVRARAAGYPYTTEQVREAVRGVALEVGAQPGSDFVDGVLRFRWLDGTFVCWEGVPAEATGGWSVDCYWRQALHEDTPANRKDGKATEPRWVSAPGDEDADPLEDSDVIAVVCYLHAGPLSGCGCPALREVLHPSMRTLTSPAACPEGAAVLASIMDADTSPAEAEVQTPAEATPTVSNVGPAAPSPTTPIEPTEPESADRDLKPAKMLDPWKPQSGPVTITSGSLACRCERCGADVQLLVDGLCEPCRGETAAPHIPGLDLPPPETDRRATFDSPAPEWERGADPNPPPAPADSLSTTTNVDWMTKGQEKIPPVFLVTCSNVSSCGASFNVTQSRDDPAYATREARFRPCPTCEGAKREPVGMLVPRMSDDPPLTDTAAWARLLILRGVVRGFRTEEAPIPCMLCDMPVLTQPNSELRGLELVALERHGIAWLADLDCVISMGILQDGVADDRRTVLEADSQERCASCQEPFTRGATRILLGPEHGPHFPCHEAPQDCIAAQDAAELRAKRVEREQEAKAATSDWRKAKPQVLKPRADGRPVKCALCKLVIAPGIEVARRLDRRYAHGSCATKEGKLMDVEAATTEVAGG